MPIRLSVAISRQQSSDDVEPTMKVVPVRMKSGYRSEMVIASLLVLAATAGLWLASDGVGHGSAQKPASKAPDEIQPSQPAPQVTAQRSLDGLSIPDVQLINQDGEPVRLYSDLARGKICVFSFIFTSCQGVCPPIGVNLGQLTQRLGDRAGREVMVISLTVDPVTDTSARLKAWSQRFYEGSGWTLLTGAKQEVDQTLKQLEVFAADKNDHSPFLLIGDTLHGSWQRVNGLTSAETTIEIIDNFQRQRRRLESKRKRSLQRAGLPVVDASASRRYFGDISLRKRD